LRGILQVTRELQIVRLTRYDESFTGHLIPADIIAAALSRPTLRAETILDGIFAECVIIVEADGDRLVYQTTLETLSNEIRIDAHFAAVGGTSGISAPSILYRKLSIPCVVIADLDLIADVDRLRTIVNAMVPGDAAKALVEEARNVACEIQKMSPSITSNEFEAELKAINAMANNMGKDSYPDVRQKLNHLAGRLDRLGNLKSGGISQLPNDIAPIVESFIGKLKQAGIFLVPVGQLEDWLASEKISASKKNKWAWANEAALVIQANGARKGDIWDFLREVAQHLRRQLKAPM
jgi:hypothetical protein